MMGAAHIPDDVRGKLAIEAIKCATQLDGLRVIKVQDKTGTQDFHVQVETELCCESSNMG